VIIEARAAEPWHQTRSRPQPRDDSHEYLNNNIQTLASVIQGNSTLALEAMATVRFRYNWRLQLRPATTLSILNRQKAWFSSAKLIHSSSFHQTDHVIPRSICLDDDQAQVFDHVD